MFILMNGSYGCLADNVECHDTYESAVESASILFDDLDQSVIDDLRENGYVDLEPGFGADYISIEEGECESDD